MNGEAILQNNGLSSLQSATLSAICQRILDAELQSGFLEEKDFSINLLNGKRADNPELETEKLVRYVQPGVQQSSSCATFQVLLKHFTREADEAEQAIQEKEDKVKLCPVLSCPFLSACTTPAKVGNALLLLQVSAFLDAVLQTAHMTVVHDYLVSRGLVPRDKNGFKTQLQQIWFGPTAQATPAETCGFEHVFVGKSQGGGEILEVYNWLQFYSLEQNGKVDYRGCILPKNRAGAEEDNLTSSDLIANVDVQFILDGQRKATSSIWLGTSPEFELALYTLCFLSGEVKSVIELSTPAATYEVEIRCDDVKREESEKIGSIVPLLLSKETKSLIQPQPTHQVQSPAPAQQQQPPPVQPPVPPKQQPLVQQKTLSKPLPPPPPPSKPQLSPPVQQKSPVQRPQPVLHGYPPAKNKAAYIPPIIVAPATPAQPSSSSSECCECLAALCCIDDSANHGNDGGCCGGSGGGDCGGGGNDGGWGGNDGGGGGCDGGGGSCS